MRRILSLTRRVFGKSDRSTERLPALRMITYPEQVSESRSVTQLPRLVVPDQNELAQDGPIQDASVQNSTNADDLELQRICEAIGIDIKEVTGEAAPRAATPAANHDLNHDLNDGLIRPDLSNDVSADVLKLIEHVEATNAQQPGFQPIARDEFEPATPSVRQTRARSPRPASRESAQTPIVLASDLADVLASLKLRLLKIRLAPDDMDEAQAEIATAIAQLRSPRPKHPIIALSLKTLVSILEKVGPAALTKDVETTLARLRAFLEQLQL